MASYLFNSSYDENHQHFCLVDDQGQGVTSDKNNHQHVIQLVSEPQLMPNGQPVIDMQGQPVMDHSFVCLPVEEDGHSHIVQKRFIYQKKKEKKKDEADYIRLAQAYYKESVDWEDMFFAPNARKCENFRALSQWDVKVLENMSPDRAALVIPIMNARLDVLKGYQRQNSSDAKIIPTEDGDVRKAAIYDQVVKHILEKNDYRTEEGLAFDDQADLGRGVLTMAIDRASDIRGEFVIEHFEWDHVKIGPFSKLNASDAEHAEKVKWVSMDLLKENYPDKAEELENSYSSYQGFYESGINDINSLDGDLYMGFRNDYDFKKRKVKTIECQYKEHRRIPVAFSIEQGLHVRLPDINKSDMDEILTIPGIEKVEERETQIRALVHAGPILLHNEISDIDEIGIYPAIAKKYKHKMFGKILEAMDMQNQINRTHSYQVDVQNHSMKNPKFYDDDTFDDEEEESNFIENGTKPEYVGKVSDVSKIPVQMERKVVDVGSERLQQASVALLHQVTNVNDSLAGQSNPYESNIAMINKQRQGLMGNEYLFDRLAMTTRRIVKAIIRAIPKVYDAERIKRILDNRHEQGKFLKIADREYAKYSEEEIMDLLNDFDVEEYDVAVTESPYSPTKRAYAKARWDELFKQSQGQIPIQFLIMLDDDIPEDQKRQLLEMLQQNSQAQSEGEIKKIETQGKFNLAQEQMKQQNKAAGMVA